MEQSDLESKRVLEIVSHDVITSKDLTLLLAEALSSEKNDPQTIFDIASREIVLLDGSYSLLSHLQQAKLMYDCAGGPRLGLQSELRASHYELKRLCQGVLRASESLILVSGIGEPSIPKFSYAKQGGSIADLMGAVAKYNDKLRLICVLA